MKIAILLLILLLGSMGSGCAEEEANENGDCSAICWLINTFQYGGISDSLDTLIQELYNDTGNEHEYIVDVYDCTNYAIDLTHNLSDVFESGILVHMSKSGEEQNHMMSWVRIDEVVYVIEPQSDLICDSDTFNASIDDDRFEITYGTEELGWTEYNTTMRII